jgi:GntR family transcriptional regulator, rspAB operon transcriptional repressor
MARTRPQLPDLSAHLVVADRRGDVGSGGRGAFARNAYEAIRHAILDCTLLPGVALSEQTLSEGLGVSRAPVRDALRQLLAESLVEVLPQRGTYVALIDPEKVRDAVFVREVIECRAAELAAGAPLVQRQALELLLERQVSAAAKHDYVSHLEADEELHYRILELAAHPHAWPALRLARTGMNRIRHLGISTVGSHQIAIDQHRLIVRAIVDGQGQQASTYMREHIRAPLGFLDAIAQRHPAYIRAG